MIISLSQETLAASSSTASVHSTGYISTLPIINLAINPQVIIGSNKLSLGFNLHHDSERSTWYSKSTLRQLGMDMNTKMIRMFTHELEPCTSWNDESKTGSFNWQSVDSLIGRIFDTGAQPLLTIGFADFNGIQIPPGMALNPSTGLPYPDSFAAYCQEWVKHFKQTGMPVKYYEIINEASYYFYPNWNWNQAKAQNYLTLYNTAYNAMHTENNQVQVGTDSSLYTQFLNFWKTNGGKLDFFSCHKYDSWGISYTDSQGLDSAERKFFGTYDSYHISISAARNLWGSNLQAIATEANFGASQSSGTDPRLQQLVGTVWTGIVLRGAILNGFDYLCYYSFSSSKTWELRNKASGGYGFGMINQDNNQPWYPYYVQSMVATNLAVGDPIVATTSSSSDVSSVAWIDAGKLNILVINKVNQQTTLSLTGLQGQLSVQKISNAISYQTPKIQTGTISASGTINLDGYAVVLIQTTTTSTPPPPPPPSPDPEPPTGGSSSTGGFFTDDFASGSFAAWDGTSLTSGETATVTAAARYEGSYGASFSSNGNGGMERAYSYKALPNAGELYVGSDVYVSQSGIAQNDDRFYFMILKSGNNGVAYAGWRMTGGVVKWNLIVRSGTGWVTAFSSSSPTLNHWYNVELHWTSNANGVGELIVDGEVVCSISGRDTSAFGNADTVLFGLAEVYNCASTAVYTDNFKIN